MYQLFKKVTNYDKTFLVKSFLAGLVILACLVPIISGCSESNYRLFFISSAGDDAHSGTSPGSAWKTLEKVNGYDFKPGDIVCFKKGDVWRGQLLPKSGTEEASITYRSYGNSERKPLILGSVSKNQVSDWTMSSENIWSTDAGNRDIGNIILNNTECGVKVWSLQELTEQNQFYYNLETRELFLFSRQNPAILYNNIECAQKRYIIDETDKNYVVYDGLSLKFGGSHGIGGANTGNITIRNCDISYIGGGDIYMDGVRRVRYGNGIEFWANAHDILVENCNISEIYDAALTNQNGGQTALQKNITYRKNKIWNSEYSFEYWNTPQESRTENIVFEENICTDAGSGWSHSQRPDKSGRHLCFYAGSAAVENFAVINNTFKNATESLVYVNLGFVNIDAVDFTDNEYFQQSNSIYAVWGLNKMGKDEFIDFINKRGVR